MKTTLITLLLVLNIIALKDFSKTTSSEYEVIQQEKDLEQSINDGKSIYADFCIRCHLAKGEGVEGIYPPLADSNWLSEKRKESIKSIKFGLKGEIEVNGKTYNNNMTSMGLTDREVADVMNYIMNDFGNEDKDLPQVTLDEVSELTESKP